MITLSKKNIKYSQKKDSIEYEIDSWSSYTDDYYPE